MRLYHSALAVEPIGLLGGGPRRVPGAVLSDPPEFLQARKELTTPHNPTSNVGLLES